MLSMLCSAATRVEPRVEAATAVLASGSNATPNVAVVGGAGLNAFRGALVGEGGAGGGKGGGGKGGGVKGADTKQLGTAGIGVAGAGTGAHGPPRMEHGGGTGVRTDDGGAVVPDANAGADSAATAEGKSSSTMSRD